MLNHSAVAASSRAHVARLSNVHPGLLLANQIEKTSDMLPFTCIGVGEVQQSCLNTLMGTVEWTTAHTSGAKPCFRVSPRHD
jgi:hypothetical protein